MRLVVDIGSGLLLALGLFSVLLALGERCLGLLRIPCPRAVRPGACFLLGSFCFGSAVLLLGLAGGLRPWALLLLTILAAASGRWRALLDHFRQMRWFLLAAVPLLPVAVAPPFFYDSWVYHLGLPWQALQDGAWRSHPDNLFSAFPPLAQLVYTVPLATGVTRATGVLHLLGFVTGGATVGYLARRLGATRSAAALAGICTLYLPTSAMVAAFPAAEAWTLAGVTTAICFALFVRPQNVAAAGAGLFMGIACAARLQGLAWAGLILPLLLVRGWRGGVRPVVTFAVGLAVGALPWWLKNAFLLRDPLAPIGWTGEGVVTLWRDAASNLNLATGPADLLSRLTGALASHGLLLAPLLLAAGVGFTLLPRRDRLLVPLAGTAGLVVWALTGALGRFLLPSLALLLAATAALGRRSGRAIAALGLTGAMLLWGAARSFSLYDALGGLAVAGSPDAVYASLVVSDPYPAFQACARLPDDARLLLVAEPRGFLLPRAFETTSQHDPSLLSAVLDRNDSALDATRELRERGYTHLLINVDEMTRLGVKYPVLPWTDADGQGRFVELTQQFGEPVVLEGNVVVYDLRR